MSLIDLASLVLAPTAVKDGKVYNAIPNDQDFTFSRGTEATRVNSAGLIEKARTNLLLQSNTFDTTWSAVNASVTAGQSGYDGSSDAWELKNNSGVTNTSRVQQLLTASSGVYSFSVYAKAGNVNYLRILSNASSNIPVAWFDLTDGTAYNVSNTIDTDSEDVGSGWYRCTITFNNSSTGCYLYPTSVAGSTLSDDGDYIYIQSAQLEQGLVSTDVITTTTSSVTVGITDDLPRVDYSGGGCPSLKLEPQRSNLMVQSEAFSTSDWTATATNTSVTANATISPEGVQNASEIEFTNTGAEIFDQFTNVASSMHIGTIFLKNKDVNTLVFEVIGGAPSIAAKVTVDLVNGTLSDEIGDFTPTIEDFGNGWYRVAIGDTGTATIATPSFKLQSVGGNTGSFYAYGAMVEVGNYSTSYIPTYGTSTSRSADSLSLTNASNLIGQSEGTLYWEGAFLNSRGTSSPFKVNRVGISDGTDTNRLFISDTTTNNQIQAFVRNATGISFNKTVTITDITDFNKIALKYKANDFALWINGVEVATDTTYNYIPVGLDRIKFEGASGSYDLEGKTKSTIVFPIALTDTQLQELTK